MPDEPAPQSLPEIIPPAEADMVASNSNLGRARQENKWFDRELAGHAAQAAALRNKLAQAYIDNLDADREMRKTYAARILKYLAIYSAGVGVFLIINGFGPHIGFSLEKEVVTTLVGSTAVAAIGLVGFIAKGLFREPPPPPPNKD